MHSILRHLEKSAETWPKKTVYWDPEESLTFEELYREARAVGTAIGKIRQPETPVAVFTGRHVHTPACYLGIALAGCFYAPMDPTMPQARLRQILDVAGAEVLIADRDTEAAAREAGFNGDLLILDDLLQTREDPEILASAAEKITEVSPLYLLFTSGSTGKPKGVLTSHLALLSYLDGLQSVIGLDDTDVIGGQAPLDYIAAIRDMYLPLMTGGSTVFLPPALSAMPQQLFEALCERGATTLCWSATGLEIPADLGAFDGDEGTGVPLPPLRRVVFSGSVISNIALRKWQDAFPETRFINQYGPTEATGSCTWYEVPSPAEPADVLPIGRAYPHYGILVLNDKDQAAAPGEIGEICVKGPALALGYYGAPEQTAACFVTNPAEDRWPETIYRTGDLGRWDETGLLYFAGRKDRQFKHLGHRIEPEEIEQKAMTLPGMRECACLYQQEKKIIWFFYTGTPEPKELTLAFRKDLPPFMVPRKTVQLEDFPRLPNGKMDRNALKEQMVSRAARKKRM